VFEKINYRFFKCIWQGFILLVNSYLHQSVCIKAHYTDHYLEDSCQSLLPDMPCTVLIASTYYIKSRGHNPTSLWKLPCGQPNHKKQTLTKFEAAKTWNGIRILRLTAVKPPLTIMNTADLLTPEKRLLPVVNYSRTPVTRTLKGNEKRSS